MTYQETLMKTSQQDTLRLIFSALLALVLAGYLGTSHAGEEGADIRKVNGSIHIDSGMVANATTVNGSIHLDENTTARSLSTVNGRVQISDGSQARSARTVNGDIRLAQDVRIEESVTTVNGGIRLEENSRVGGSVETVNGRIELSSARVARDISTVNGDVTLGKGSIVEGDISFEKPGRRWFGMGRVFSQKPVLRIDANSEVHGTIHLHQEVRLEIDDKARVGDIQRHF